MQHPQDAGRSGSPFIPPGDRYSARIRFAPPDDDGISGTFEPIVFKVDDSPAPAEKSHPEIEVDLADPEPRKARSDIERGDRTKRDDDIEIDIEGEEKPKAPPPRKPAEAAADDDEPVTPRVQKRIDKAIRKQREAERAAQEASVRAEAAERAARDAGQRFQQADTVAFSSYKQSVEGEIARLEQDFKAAYDAGDSAKLWEVQRKLASAQGKADWIASEERRRPKPGQPQPRQAHPEQPRQPAKVEPTTLKWVDDNGDWFNGDSEDHRVMTAAAYALDGVLKGEGLDPNTPAFWQEMDRRLDAKFPHLRQRSSGQPEARHQGNGSPVAGPSRGTPGGKQRVVLSQAEMKIARDLNITPQDYAREKLKLESGHGSYA